MFNVSIKTVLTPSILRGRVFYELQKTVEKPVDKGIEALYHIGRILHIFVFMRKAIKPKTDKMDQCINPFSVSLVVSVRAIPQHGKNGRIKDIELEAQTYTKIFRKPETRHRTMRLSPSALKLLKWIEFEVAPAKDYVWINRARFMKEANLSSNHTMSDAIKDLVSDSFICSSAVQGVYWINPDLFFCGSRVKKYPDKVSRKIDALKDATENFD